MLHTIWKSTSKGRESQFEPDLTVLSSQVLTTVSNSYKFNLRISSLVIGQVGKLTSTSLLRFTSNLMQCLRNSQLGKTPVRLFNTSPSTFSVTTGSGEVFRRWTARLRMLFDFVQLHWTSAKSLLNNLWLFRCLYRAKVGSKIVMKLLWCVLKAQPCSPTP